MDFQASTGRLVMIAIGAGEFLKVIEVAVFFDKVMLNTSAAVGIYCWGRALMAYSVLSPANH